MENTIETTDIKTKQCKKCFVVKPVDDFYKGHGKCKKCENELRHDRYMMAKQNLLIIDPTKTKICVGCNEELPVIAFRDNRNKCKNCEKTEGKEYRRGAIGKAKAQQWIEDNRARMTELQANWHQNNKPKINEKFKQRFKNDFAFKLYRISKSRIGQALKDRKTKHTIEYINCTSDQYKQWMMFCFDKNMTIENHGSLWHVDHVIPVDTFDLEDEDDIYLCFNWRNTMPINAHDNLTKNNKINPEQIKTHLTNLTTFHKQNNMELPKQFIELYAKHLNNREVP